MELVHLVQAKAGAEMIQATLKGEHYIKRLDAPETKEEVLLTEIVDMGVPVSVLELSHMSKMSTNRVEGIVRNLRRSGLIEVEPDSFAGKTAAGVLRGLKKVARSSQSMDGNKLDRIILGDTNLLFGTPKVKREEREVLRGSEHAVYRPVPVRKRFRSKSRHDGLPRDSVRTRHPEQ